MKPPPPHRAMRPSDPRQSAQEYIPLDDTTAPPSSVWKSIILLLLGILFLTSMWVFSELPGSLSIRGEATWSSNQTWVAAVHFSSIAVASLLTWLKR